MDGKNVLLMTEKSVDFSRNENPQQGRVAQV
jgi:hypothetical protein